MGSEPDVHNWLPEEDDLAHSTYAEADVNDGESD